MVFYNTASSLLKQAVDMVLPPRCVVTGEIVSTPGTISTGAFTALDFIARPFCECCGLPFGFDMEQGSLCVACLDDPPAFTTARAALKYNDASRKMILGFKHGDQLHVVSAFAPWLKRAGQEIIEGADFFAPVPLHRWRLLSRRYNQAMILASGLSKLTNVPVIPDLLVRIRATPSQGHMKAGERVRNVAGAFRLNLKYAARVKDKKIVLIDDVFTTGSTVRECAKTLVKAGAAEVRVLVLARAAKGDGF